jgi:hypothetical protein
MLLTLISCLLVSSALAASEKQCEVGDVTFTGFDINQVSVKEALCIIQY